MYHSHCNHNNSGLSTVLTSNDLKKRWLLQSADDFHMKKAKIHFLQYKPNKDTVQGKASLFPDFIITQVPNFNSYDFNDWETIGQHKWIEKKKKRTNNECWFGYKCVEIKLVGKRLRSISFLINVMNSWLSFNSFAL